MAQRADRLSQQEQQTSPESAISLRAAAIGLALALAVSFWGQYASDKLGYDPTYAQLPACLVLPFLVLVLGPNLLCKALFKRSALARSELLVIFAMGLVASLVPDRGMTRYLIGVLTTPYYFGTPENQWSTKFFAYLPDWAVLGDELGAATGFFEGIDANQPIPWGTWLTPLFWWGTLIAALMFAGTSFTGGRCIPSGWWWSPPDRCGAMCSLSFWPGCCRSSCSALEGLPCTGGCNPYLWGCWWDMCWGRVFPSWWIFSGFRTPLMYLKCFERE